MAGNYSNTKHDAAHKGVECDLKYIKLLGPYLNENRSDLADYAKQLLMSGDPNIEKNFKEFPVYYNLKAWKTELTNILVEDSKWDKITADEFSDIHIVFCCGVISLFFEQEKGNSLESSLSELQSAYYKTF